MRSVTKWLILTLLTLAAGIGAVTGCGGSESLPEPGPIVFTSWPEDITQVGVMDADGSDPRRVRGTGASDGPSWSPDGSKIAFSFAPIDCFELPACAEH